MTYIPIESVDLDRVLKDSFGRLKVSNPETFFDSKFRYGLQSRHWHTLTATGGAVAHGANEALVNMTVTSSTGSRAVRQSRLYVPYQPGKAKLAVLKGVLNASGGSSGIRARIGMFDNHADKSVDAGGDGVFFQLDGTTLSVVIRSYVSGTQVDTVIAQSSWNLDKLNGTGASGVTLDPSKLQIFLFDFQGYGAVRFGTMIDDRVIWCHEAYYANVSATIPFRTSALPVRYELENTGAGSASTMKQVSATVVLDGGYSQLGGVYGADMAATPKSIGTTLEPLISIRAKSSYNRITLHPLSISVALFSLDNVRWSLLYGASLTGASWSDISAGISGTEYDVAATALSGGLKVASGYVNEDAGTIHFNTDHILFSGSDIAGNPDIITLAIQNDVGSVNVVGAIDFQEWL